MKKTLLVVFFLLSLFSFFSSYLEKISEETEKFRNSIMVSSKVIVIDDKNIINEDNIRKKEIVDSMSYLSEVYSINIFKYDIEKENSTFFTKINFNLQHILKELNMDIPANSEQFIVTNEAVFSKKNKYTLKDFDQLKQSNFLSGRYILQYKKENDIFAFCENLQKSLSINIEIQEDERQYSNIEFFKILNGIIIITLILVILLYYFYNYKNNTIKNYFGYSNLQLVNDIYKSLLPMLFLILISSSLCSLFFYYSGINYVQIFNLMFAFFSNGLLFLLISYIFVGITIKLSKKDWLSFKGKKVLLPILIIGLIFTYLIIPLISFGLSESIPLAKENLYLAAKKKKNKQVLKDYVYLPLLSAGVGTEDEDLLVPSFQHHNQLFNKLYKEGLLLFRLEDSTRNKLNGIEYEDNYSSNEVWMTPKFLNELSEVKDLNNQKINISNNESNLIILIPEELKKEIEDIKKYYVKSHDFYDFEVAQEFSKLKIEKKTKNIQFIFIKNNPKLSSFKPPKQNLKNPLIRIITPYNVQQESSVYADIILGQTDSFFVKDSQMLSKIIKKNDNYNEFPVKINAYNHLMSTFREDIQLVGTLLIIILSLITLYYIITYFLSGVFFSINQKKIKLNILFGGNINIIIIQYLIIYLLPWLSILFFDFSKEGLLLVASIIIGSMPIIYINFKKVCSDLTNFE